TLSPAFGRNRRPRIVRVLGLWPMNQEHKGIMTTKKRVQTRGVVAIATSLLAGLASAGEIRGKATDSTGGALRGAEIRVENLASRDVNLLLADTTGAYSFSGIPAGMYRVIALSP